MPAADASDPCRRRVRASMPSPGRRNRPGRLSWNYTESPACSGPRGLGEARKGSEIRAVDPVRFPVRSREIVGSIEESGSGKSTLDRIVIGLEEAVAGAVHFRGKDLAHLPARARPKDLIRAVRIISQNPDDTLDPAHRFGRILERAFKRCGRAHSRDEVAALRDPVRLPPEVEDWRPSALSGGQIQRIAVARAFAGGGDLILADEPVSALGVSVQAAIIALLHEAQRERGTAILFISHDSGPVRHMSDRVVVLFQGTDVESGTVCRVFHPPSHADSEARPAAAHPADPEFLPKPLQAPNSSVPPQRRGCPFVQRCHRSMPCCHTGSPPNRAGGAGHVILCQRDAALLQGPSGPGP